MTEASNSKIKEIQNLSFEKAMQELEKCVSQMESSEKGLDNIIESFEYGTALKKHLETKLTEAKTKITKISGE